MQFAGGFGLVVDGEHGEATSVAIGRGPVDVPALGQAKQGATHRREDGHRARLAGGIGVDQGQGQRRAAGLVDELADVDHVVTRTLAWLDPLLQLPRQAMLGTRALARADLARLFDDPASLPVEDFLDSWFAPEAQATLHTLVERLRNKKPV